MTPEQLEPSSSPVSALALSNIEEGMGHNAERAHELQQVLVQQRASSHQELAEAQALQDKEALLANIIEEEMAHQHRYQSCLTYIFSRPKKLSPITMKLGTFPLCW